MRNLALALSLSLALFGCPKKKNAGADAAADAEPVVAAIVDSGPAAPEATNVNDVARFGDEAKIDREVAKTEAPLTIARKAPPYGDPVARLARATEVTKIASHDGRFLVTFANPKKAGERLMGWVGPEAFKAPAAAAQKCKADKECAAGFVCIPHETGTKCEKSCAPTNTAACPAKYECKGEGANAEGKMVQYCVSIAPPDAGAPRQTDAGAAPPADASAPKGDSGK